MSVIVRKTPSAIARRRARGGECGATVFVVVLVIAMLTGIGLFAAQASTIATSTSGISRVTTQSRYFGESAMHAVTAKLSRDLGAQIDFLARQNSTECLGMSGDPYYQNCTRFGRTYLEQELRFALFQPYDAQTGHHGTLGRSENATADLLVEMNDLYRIDRPIAGFDYTSAGAANVHFMSVMLHGTGRIRLAPPNGVASTLSSTTFRAELVVGPISGP
ncbi:hypothetical protein KEG38_10225 [Polyangium jinanense]|uniref:hypothetical protein n=1 Tax=Polyangium jinanense TaxID=2829994 RepID=UPI002340452B|nr:hypothetical protein [Polyangium jinanense]MDC3954226.1 hypothetical protein [Polyangium jinanense]